MIAEKLSKGDTIRVISPSRGFMPWMKDLRLIAEKRFADLGYNITFGKYVSEIDEFSSTTIEHRIEDLHNAFQDPDVKLIITVIGGFNSNQLLRYIDWDLIRNNPKLLCGYSDITALSNATYAKTGLVTYSGPHFFNFGEIKGFDYTLEYFNKCLCSEELFTIIPPETWSDDTWGKDQENRTFLKNNGFCIIHEGQTEGILIGGNLCTFNLLQGTEFMPSLDNTILFIEDDDETYPATFDRDLQSLIHQPEFNKVNGIIIGRFQKKSEISLDLLQKIINTKRELTNLPILADVDFGHTFPRITYPIGGIVKIDATNKKIEVIKH